MSLFRWFNRSVKQREQTKSEAIIRRVVRLFDLPVVESEPGLWSVVGTCRDTYRVCLFIWADERKLNFMATCQLSVERELLPRELLLTVLEENHRLEQGAFRLVPREDRRLLVLGQILDNDIFSEPKLFHLGQTLIERMQRMVCKLYGMELILDGPSTHSQQDLSPFQRKER
jgi:hypothetical protein